MIVLCLKKQQDLTMGNTAGSFFGRVTDLVEPDVIKDFQPQKMEM